MADQDRILPRYPVYIPSKGRAEVCLTARQLREAGVPFTLVVEPTEADAYARQFGRDCLFVLPFHDLGLGSIPARNALWEHAKARGAERHWTLDDNMRAFYRRYGGLRLYCDAGIALRATEDFVDRYENIAIAGLNYTTFIRDDAKAPPFALNHRVYSCMLIRSDLPIRWRGRYNEDTDLCLQALSLGWCTVLLNAFFVEKRATMRMRGGNTDALYQGDGRLQMARALERMWPGVVTIDRRWKRPQHVVNWRKFTTPLRLKPGVDLAALPPIYEYGAQLTQVSDQVRSPRLRRLLEDWRATHDDA